MERPKALLPWQGSTFLEGAIDLLAPQTEMVIVVGGLKRDVARRSPKLIVRRDASASCYALYRVTTARLEDRRESNSCTSDVTRTVVISSLVAGPVTKAGGIWTHFPDRVMYRQGGTASLKASVASGPLVRGTRPRTDGARQSLYAVP